MIKKLLCSLIIILKHHIIISFKQLLISFQDISNYIALGKPITQEQFEKEQDLYFKQQTLQNATISQEDIKFVLNIDIHELTQKISEVVQQNYNKKTLVSAFTGQELFRILNVAKAILCKKQDLEQVNIKDLNIISQDLSNYQQYHTLYQDTKLFVNKEVKKQLSKKISELNQENKQKNKHQVTIVGDTHGTWETTQYVFQNYDSNYFIFNGDYVDRGQNSVENIIFLLIKMIQSKGKVILLRGNHEIASVCSNYSFLAELFMKFDLQCEKLFKAFKDVMELLPIAAKIDNQIFICHGGPNTSMYLTSLFENLRRNREPEVVDEDPLNHILWNDITDDVNYFEVTENLARGAGKIVGRNATERFLRLNKTKILIRSHECIQEGFQPMNENTAYTLFSVSRYNGADNKGAVMSVDIDNNNCYQLIADQFMLNTSASIDQSLFCNEQLISKYSDLTTRELKDISKVPEQMKLFYCYFSMGMIEYDVQSPQKIKCLIDANGVEHKLKTRYQAYQECNDILINNLQDYIDEHLQSDIKSLLFTIDSNARADACLCGMMNKSLGELGIQLPKQLFCGCDGIQSDELDKLIKRIDEKTDKIVAQKLQRRQQLLHKKQQQHKQQKK